MIGRSLTLMAMAASTFGAGLITIAQGVLDPAAITLERILGGGVLMTAAILFVRWGRQSTADMRATLTVALDKTQATLDQTIEILQAERHAWNEERKSIKSERDHIRSQLMETQQQLTAERNLRISLEQAGVHDRRSTGNGDNDGGEIPGR